MSMAHVVEGHFMPVTYTPILYKRYYLFHYFSLMKSSENCAYFFTCILPDYMAHEISKEF